MLKIFALSEASDQFQVRRTREGARTLLSVRPKAVRSLERVLRGRCMLSSSCTCDYACQTMSVQVDGWFQVPSEEDS